MNCSYSYEPSDLAPGKLKPFHAPCLSDFVFQRDSKKEKKTEKTPELILNKLLSVEDEWAKYKTATQKARNMKFPKSSKLNKLTVAMSNSDTATKLAINTFQLLTIKKTKGNLGQKEIKKNLSSLISSAAKEIRKQRISIS